MTDIENAVEEAPKPTLVIKPGRLVSLKTEVTGGLHRETKNLPVNVQVPADTEVRRYEALVTKVDERKLAEKCRDECRYMVTSLCEQTRWGLLCPPENEDALQVAMRGARRKAREFNKTAHTSFVEVDVIDGVIGNSDGTLNEFSEKMRRILDEMAEGIKGADVKAIRAAISQARDLKKMIASDDHAGKVALAIDQARKVANAQAKAIREAEKRGESAAAAIALAQTSDVQSARAAFLVADEGDEVEEAVPVPAARALQAEDVLEIGESDGGESDVDGESMAASS